VKRNQVRIIGGAWRSRLVRFSPQKDLRPTPDRVRETLFNWLGQDLSGKTCLDLFAGSGALGFEAASRGAKRVVMVEHDRSVFAALQAGKAGLGAAAVELERADALEFLRGDGSRYDIIFLDPPFRADHYWRQLLPLLPRHMTPGALVYCESAAPPELPPGWETWRQGRAGQVRYQLLKRTEHEQQGGLPGNVRSHHTGP
jgi:16S rRNA (guanine966-N2)-methyltransferase